MFYHSPWAFRYHNILLLWWETHQISLLFEHLTVWLLLQFNHRRKFETNNWNDNSYESLIISFSPSGRGSRTETIWLYFSHWNCYSWLFAVWEPTKLETENENDFTSMSKRVQFQIFSSQLLVPFGSVHDKKLQRGEEKMKPKLKKKNVKIERKGETASLCVLNIRFFWNKRWINEAKPLHMNRLFTAKIK